MKKMTSWLLVLLGLVPVIMSNLSLSPASDGKILATRGIACIAALSFTILFALPRYGSILVERVRTVFKRPTVIAMTIATGLLAVSTACAFDRYVAFFGEATRGEGFIGIFTLYILYIFCVVLFDEQKWWNRFFGAIAVSSVIVFAKELVQAGQGMYRPVALLGNPIFVASFFLFSFFIGWHFLLQYQRKQMNVLPLIGISLMVMSMIGIFISKTRGTLLAIAISAIICSIVAIVMGKNTTMGKCSVRMIGSVLLIVVIGFGALFGVTRNAEIWQHVPGLNRIAANDVSSLDSRLIYLHIVKEGFIASTPKQKLVGWGWDNFWFFADKNYDSSVYFYDPSSIDRSHNKLGDMLIMTGIIGLLTYLTIWACLIREIWIMLKRNLLLGLGLLFTCIAYFVHNLFAFDVLIVLFVFYMFIGFVSYVVYEKK